VGKEEPQSRINIEKKRTQSERQRVSGPETRVGINFKNVEKGLECETNKPGLGSARDKRPKEKKQGE